MFSERSGLVLALLSPYLPLLTATSSSVVASTVEARRLASLRHPAAESDDENSVDHDLGCW